MKGVMKAHEKKFKIHAKGLRRLAHGEVIREGDTHVSPFHESLQTVSSASWGRAIDEHHNPHFRKVRTEGAPPGWRWADAWELGIVWWKCADGSLFLENPDHVLLEDSVGEFANALKPYPEDPRPSPSSRGATLVSSSGMSFGATTSDEQGLVIFSAEKFWREYGPSAVSSAPGIGVSAPRKVVYIQDPSGDDVARTLTPSEIAEWNRRNNK